jgi:hypothetical protein
VNGALKGGFVNIEHRFVRVFGLTKTGLFLAFAAVGFNLDRIRSFSDRQRAEQAAMATSKRTRAKRREGTWADVIDPKVLPKAGRAPPPHR